jgi:hypothetical protein
VCVDRASGAIRVTKVASTPANPAIGLKRGIDAIHNAAGVEWRRCTVAATAHAG